MDGQVRVESEPGEGSKFVLTIPFVTVSRLTVPVVAETHDLNGMRVLAVDEHAANRSILGQIAGSLGAEVVETGSGEEALDAIRQANDPAMPSRSLLDTGMPG